MALQTCKHCRENLDATWCCQQSMLPCERGPFLVLAASQGPSCPRLPRAMGPGLLRRSALFLFFLFSSSLFMTAPCALCRPTRSAAMLLGAAASASSLAGPGPLTARAGDRLPGTLQKGCGGFSSPTLSLAWLFGKVCVQPKITLCGQAPAHGLLGFLKELCIFLFFHAC